MTRRVTVLSLVVLVGATLLPGFASGHQRQWLQVGPTDYLFVIGSIGEPVYTGDKSGVELTVLVSDPANPMDSRAKKVKPVEGLEKTLRIEIKAGPHARVWPQHLRRRHRSPWRQSSPSVISHPGFPPLERSV